MIFLSLPTRVIWTYVTISNSVSYEKSHVFELGQNPTFGDNRCSRLHLFRNLSHWVNLLWPNKHIVSVRLISTRVKLQSVEYDIVTSTNIKLHCIILWELLLNCFCNWKTYFFTYFGRLWSKEIFSSKSTQRNKQPETMFLISSIKEIIVDWHYVSTISKIFHVICLCLRVSMRVACVSIHDVRVAQALNIAQK